MHDFLIALVFVSMVASPAIVAALPQRDEDEEGENMADTVDIPSNTAASCG
jgi:hypothetical protein